MANVQNANYSIYKDLILYQNDINLAFLNGFCNRATVSVGVPEMNHLKLIILKIENRLYIC